MKTPAERLTEWIDGLSERWKDRLRGWMVSWAVRSITDALEDMTPEQKSSVDAIVDHLRDDPNMPDFLKPFLEQSKKKGHPALIIIGIIFGVIFIYGMIAGTFRPAGNLSEYEQERVTKSFRLDPISIITAWRRDPETYEKYFADLRDQGWSDERIDALKFFTLFYPSPGDLVRWQAREVFEPAMIEKYGLKAELGELRREDFYKAGMSDEQIDNYWMAHWEHPELRTIVEMLRRTDFSEDDMRAWFRLVEIPPFWRDKLIEISYEVPTRVDVRRWWDMRTIDEARLREVYTHQGYHGKDLDDYVLWTKVYVAFPDLIARWKNGFITLDEVRAELTGYGMPAERLEELIETKMEATEGERTTTERNLTKTEIYKGVKKELITWGEGLELLMDLGYDEDEATYILEVNVGALAGSPETFEEFKRLTTGWRKAAGVKSTPELEALRQAAAEVVKLTRDLAVLKERVKEEERGLVAGKILPPGATAKVDELRVALHHAEATLAAAKSHYDALIAEWRHKA